MVIPEELQRYTVHAILKHAEEVYPEECCGVVVVTEQGIEKYVRCLNNAKDPTKDFRIDAQSFMEAEDIGDVVGIVHSHPDGTTKPSAYDVAVMSKNREIELGIDPESQPIPWHIVSWPEADYRQIIPEITKDLLGKPFVHGVWDCWQLCNDYYKKYHGIEFKNFAREDLWWEEKDGESLYESQYEEAGFYLVDKPEPGDMLVMQIGKSFHPNHAGIYLGYVEEFEGRRVVGGPFMTHHMYGRNSDVVVYGGQWSARTRMILRHKEVK